MCESLTCFQCLVEDALALGESMTALLDRAKLLYDSQSDSPSAFLESPPHNTRSESRSRDPDESVELMEDLAEDEAEETSPGSISSTNELDIPIEQYARSVVESTSRQLTIEEGEVFRRRNVLDETDFAKQGDELKEELLAVEVDRSPRPLPVIDSDIDENGIPLPSPLHVLE
jgi:hypothetical protein